MTARKRQQVEILDATLRDGEQTPGVSFTPAEKLQIARTLIERCRVDRLEIASARVSEGETEAARKIIAWADKRGRREAIEILGFVDRGRSIAWIAEVGGCVINLLAKGSEKHCRVQLRKSPEQHFDDIAAEVTAAARQGLTVNLYLEDWSNGMRASLPYVFAMVNRLTTLPVARIMLPDTLGILAPEELSRYLSWMIATFPKARFDFHGHNDYGLGVANSLAAVRAGVNGVHVTVNGLGERTGNVPLCQVIAAIHDHTEIRTRVNEKQLSYTSTMVQAISGKRLAANAPIVGSDVFTQTCGVHADGDKKGNLYANPLLPERFGRSRRYALGKLSGRASIDQNLEAIGMELEPEERDRVLHEVVRLGDKKKKLTPEDLQFIVADVMKTSGEHVFTISRYHVATSRDGLPRAEVELSCRDRHFSAKATGDGGYDAFMKALRMCVRELGLKLPRLRDYEVHIPPGGKSDALVEATVTWDIPDAPPLVTVGIDSDQLEAAIQATEKMLNLVVAARLP